MLFVACARYKLDDTVEFLKRNGYTACGAPILDTVPVSYTFPEDVEGIFLTSSAPIDLIQHHELATYAIGQKTAERAQQKGFNVVYVGHGNAQDMANNLAKENLPKICWHPTNNAGKKEWYQTLEQTIIKRDIVYSLEFIENLPEDMVEKFNQKKITQVLLMSSMGAQNFAKLIAKYSLDISDIHLIAFSKAIVKEVIHLPFAKKTTLPHPSLEALQQIQMT